MNKDKAIQLLERLQDPEPYEPMLTKDAYDAIQMAIDALSADGDTISRKAAIDVIDSFNVFESRSDQIKLEQMIGELPPAQPEQLSTNLAEVGTKIEPLTDKEQRIFLAAMGRERKVCKEVDDQYTHEPYEVMLTKVCSEIERKVKAALWS